MTPVVTTRTESTWEMVYLVRCYNMASDLDKGKTHDLPNINHPMSKVITNPPLRKMMCTAMGIL
jgi:hypothetical protein